MSLKTEQWKKEIERLNEGIAKSKNRIRDLEQKIALAEKEEEIANNKMIADAVRAACGEVTEENIQQLLRMIRENGHSISETKEMV